MHQPQLAEQGAFEIRLDDLTGEKIIALLRQHMENMLAITPIESVHALDLEGLRKPNISFWSLWQGETLLGCGALKELDGRSGEIKSMRTADAYRRRGVASRVLEHIIQEAQKRQYDYLYLETGSMEEFAAARALYTRYSFEYTDPFADYIEDPNSVFMMKRL
ncbi:MAG: GNAT family N-acetyltransferase [Deinococcales bacterium]